MERMADLLLSRGYDSAVITDINCSTGVLEFVKLCQEKGLRGYAGMEFRDGDRLLYFCIAKNNRGFAELNELMTNCNVNGKRIPETAPEFNHVHVVYPFGSKEYTELRDFEYIGVQPKHLTKLILGPQAAHSKYVIWKPVTFENAEGHQLHKQLRAINQNILLSQLMPFQHADSSELLCRKDELLDCYKDFPQVIANTEHLLWDSSFSFDFETPKNKRNYTGTVYGDKEFLEMLALNGCKERYGAGDTDVLNRVKRELETIHELGFSSYFLTTWDIIRETTHRGFYHVGRGSGANSVVAYCLKITDVCPIELDLYFERFLNRKRKSPPDFDIDYSWKDRDEVFKYIFGRYGKTHTALLGAMSTFRDRSIIRELGKVYGLPKGDIDRLIDEPDAVTNKNEITNLVLSAYNQMADFPNNRSIHAGGVLISELPISNYVALDMPPKGFQTAQFDMYAAEDIKLEKLDILSQRGIGHINECVEIVRENRGIIVDAHDIDRFKKDEKVRLQLKSGDTIGCFYIESPAMRQLLKKLRCGDYLTLVAASSIIRPGVAKSGMMKEYIYRYHNPDKFQYLHPIMEEQLKETFGVMVFQEDVLKVCIHFGGLDGDDADVVRRLMSGKNRGRHHLVPLEQKFFSNCQKSGYDETVSREVWRQIESFAGYSFSKAHSASYAVESYQSLFLKSHYPKEFATAVINNFGGFYATRVYVNEAQKCGAKVFPPCVNNSLSQTSIKGSDIYLGFAHVQHLEASYQHGIPLERDLNGPYKSLADFVARNRIKLTQLSVLIRVGAFRFTGKSKKSLLWEAHVLCNKDATNGQPQLFQIPAASMEIPDYNSWPLEDAYDEIELLGFPLSLSMFDLAKSSYRGESDAKGMANCVGKKIRMVGNYITSKQIGTTRGEMRFGTFLDADGNFFDTTHFPQSYSRYKFNGAGIYLLEGRVIDDAGFPSMEVDRMGKLAIKADPRSVQADVNPDIFAALQPGVVKLEADWMFAV